MLLGHTQWRRRCHVHFCSLWRYVGTICSATGRLTASATDLNISRILNHNLLFIGKLLWAIALAVIWHNIIAGWLIVALVAGNLSQKAAWYGKVIKNTFPTSDLMWNYFYRSLKQLSWAAERVQSLKIVTFLRLQIAQSRSRN